jgi:hypothetical protein
MKSILPKLKTFTGEEEKVVSFSKEIAEMTSNMSIAKENISTAVMIIIIGRDAL